MRDFHCGCIVPVDAVSFDCLLRPFALGRPVRPRHVVHSTQLD